MSDGGAGAIVEVVSLLAKSRAGRIALVVIACYLGLEYVVSQVSRAALAGIVVVAAGLAALAAAFVVQRRRRRARASLYQWLALFGLVIVAGATALFVIARRRKASAPGAPPSAEEVERLAAMEGAGQ
jgi:multisubunit Na+/H+ antiporter MnhB subunit